MNPAARGVRVPRVKFVSGSRSRTEADKGVYGTKSRVLWRTFGLYLQAGEVKERNVNEVATRSMFRGLLIVFAMASMVLVFGAAIAFAHRGGQDHPPGTSAASTQYDDEGAAEDNSGPGNAHDDDDCAIEDNSGPGNARDRARGEEDNSGPGNARDRATVENKHQIANGKGPSAAKAAARKAHKADDDEAVPHKAVAAPGEAANASGPQRAKVASGKGGVNAVPESTVPESTVPESTVPEDETDADCGEVDEDEADEDEAGEATNAERTRRAQTR